MAKDAKIIIKRTFPKEVSLPLRLKVVEKVSQLIRKNYHLPNDPLPRMLGLPILLLSVKQYLYSLVGIKQMTFFPKPKTYPDPPSFKQHESGGP